MTKSSARAAKKWTELFYEVPVEAVRAGASTDDAQDVVEVDFSGKEYVRFETYTPRPDDAELDSRNRQFSQTTLVAHGRQVQLCVFIDTAVDLSSHPKATNFKVREVSTGRETPITRAEWLVLQAENGHLCK